MQQQVVGNPSDFQRIFGVSRETTEKLETYAGLLAQWQKAVQLVAPSTLSQVWSRHFADSAQVLRLAPVEASTWLDLGSGGGFPGLVVAILAGDPVLRPKPLKMTLIESDTRKAAFLREVARRTGVAVDILGARIESPSTQAKVGPVDVISARALAPLDVLFGLAFPFWQPDTTGLFLKGREADTEVEAARLAWQFKLDLESSLTDPAARIARVRDLKPLERSRGGGGGTTP